MSFILHIDTATDIASVCLSENGELIKLVINEKQRDHASWLQTGIKKLLEETNKKMQHLAAISVSIGPGSYTGLRIGLSSAKGLCYALNIPLIGINTLDMMAACIEHIETDYICPMIDARRMEVYTAVYNKTYQRIMEPAAVILDEKSFSNLLHNHSILFFGNGSNKFKSVATDRKSIFSEILPNASGLIKIAQNRYDAKDFSNLAYTEPNYIKEFNSSVR